MKKNFCLALILYILAAIGSGPILAATPNLIETHSERQKALKELRGQQLAYIEIEKAAALMEFYGQLLENADLEKEIDPFFLHQLYRSILKPIENAQYLAHGDRDLSVFAYYWTKKINRTLYPAGQAALSALDRKIASAANRFQVDHEEMTIRLVPIRQKIQYRHVKVEMRLKAAKAIADSTVKLANSDSLNRLFTYNSDSSFLYNHGQPDSLRVRSLSSRASLTKVMLLQVSHQLDDVLLEKKMAPVRGRAIELIKKNKVQEEKVKNIPVSEIQMIKSQQTRIAAETEFELRQMLARLTNSDVPQ